MPFFENASNFTIKGNTAMYDVTGDLHQNQMAVSGNNNVVNYAPYQTINPWTISFQQNQYSQTVPNVDEIPNPNIADWFSGTQSSKPQTQNPPRPPQSQQPQPQRPPSAGSAVKQDEEQPLENEQAIEPLGTWYDVMTFLTNTLPRQIYHHLLLRLPSLYLSRISQIFQDANLSYAEMKDLSLRSIVSEDRELLSRITASIESLSEVSSVELPASYETMKDRWEHFIDGLLEEWRTLNIVSALLVPGVLTMFQIPGAASADPVTRYLSFWSLLCALVSLLYGCIYTIQFSRMRRAYNILEWGLEMQARRWMFWDVTIMLAMPILWLTWSILAFIVCIVWFMWRASTNFPSNATFPVSYTTELGFRIFVCVALGVAIIYGVLILLTFRKYGSSLSAAWQKRAKDLLDEYQSTILKAHNTAVGGATATPTRATSTTTQEVRGGYSTPLSLHLLSPTGNPSRQGSSQSDSRTPSPTPIDRHSFQLRS